MYWRLTVDCGDNCKCEDYSSKTQGVQGSVSCVQKKYIHNHSTRTTSDTTKAEKTKLFGQLHNDNKANKVIAYWWTAVPTSQCFPLVLSDAVVMYTLNSCSTNAIDPQEHIRLAKRSDRFSLLYWSRLGGGI